MTSLNTASAALSTALNQNPLLILSPQDVFKTLEIVEKNLVTTTILDPWYNKGVGDKRDDYHQWLYSLLSLSAEKSQHIFLWGFPEIVYKGLDHIPTGFELVAWHTWYYKNCPSVIRGWRSSHLTCLHIAKSGAKIYPEHFLNEAQLAKKKQGKHRYMPGPTSVIETPQDFYTIVVRWEEEFNELDFCKTCYDNHIQKYFKSRDFTILTSNQDYWNFCLHLMLDLFLTKYATWIIHL